MGSNMIMIHPGNMDRGGVRQSQDDMQSLELSDYEALRDRTAYISAISPNVSSSGQFIYGNNNYPSSMYGVNADYLDIRKITIASGEIFTEQDIKQAAKVCLLGQTVIDNLFPNGEDPIGKVVRFNKIPFTVIGTLTAKGTNTMGMDQDDVVLAPYTTVMKRVLAVDYLQGLFASALSEDMTDEAIDEITEILRQQHKLKDDADDDFEIRSQQELSQDVNTASTD
jgi:putative ABC transport system permease protein